MAASPAAARLHDPVAHSHALGGFLAGAAVGLAAAFGAAVVIGAVVGAVAAEVASGGLATPLVVGAVATVGEFGLNAVVGGKLMGLAEQEGEALGASSMGPASGAIADGARNVKINGLPAARALDPDSCDASKLAQGSELVAINGRPASRVGDKTTCGATVVAGSPNVVIGGPPATMAPIQSEVPSWARWAVVVAGLLPALGGLARTIGPALAEVEATGFARAAQTGVKALGRALEERAGGAAPETGPAPQSDPVAEAPAEADAVAEPTSPSEPSAAAEPETPAGTATERAAAPADEGSPTSGAQTTSPAAEPAPAPEPDPPPPADATAQAVSRMPPDFQAEYAQAEAAGWTKPDGSRWWPPNNGGVGTPTVTTVDPPAVLDRFGGEGGSYLSAAGDSFESRALPGAPGAPATNYDVLKATPVEQSEIAPWFGQPGGGAQYRLINPDGSGSKWTVQQAIGKGYLGRQ